MHNPATKNILKEADAIRTNSAFAPIVSATTVLATAIATAIATTLIAIATVAKGKTVAPVITIAAKAGSGRGPETIIAARI